MVLHSEMHKDSPVQFGIYLCGYKRLKGSVAVSLGGSGLGFVVQRVVLVPSVRLSSETYNISAVNRHTQIGEGETERKQRPVSSLHRHQVFLLCQLLSPAETTGFSL